ncbi:PQQ-binding-like beta-propeller repeat protein [Aliikangiella coralliicola]|uniref:PQQ-binding-like beta-propeller repeat protein n=1 Tax=Aliikangiella coralliicola TaxID=2592383 RepID=A0A545UHM9_9GAMM|nr:PQQ-binding-like beta-propeller repeat protein [Aliikangiella coralliicola]TQV88981.1 PQQ-binding-like beta-propeller repeat protein [Aliikangiella coralliicola]
MEKIYLGMNGYVVCLKQKNGEEIWRTKLKSSQITNITLDDDKIYASAGGHLFCVNAKNGKIIWENGLSGLGYGACIIATSNQSASVIAANIQAQQSASIAAGAGATTAATSS